MVNAGCYLGKQVLQGSRIQEGSSLGALLLGTALLFVQGVPPDGRLILVGAVPVSEVEPGPRDAVSRGEFPFRSPEILCAYEGAGAYAATYACWRTALCHGITLSALRDTSRFRI